MDGMCPDAAPDVHLAHIPLLLSQKKMDGNSRDISLPVHCRHPLYHHPIPHPWHPQSDPHALRYLRRCKAAAGAVPRNAHERVPLLPVWIDVLKRAPCKMAPLDQNCPHDIFRMPHQRGC